MLVFIYIHMRERQTISASTSSGPKYTDDETTNDSIDRTHLQNPRRGVPSARHSALCCHRLHQPPAIAIDAPVHADAARAAAAVIALCVFMAIEMSPIQSINRSFLHVCTDLRRGLWWGLLVPDTDGVVGGACGEAPPEVVELRVQNVVAVARVHCFPFPLTAECWGGL